MGAAGYVLVGVASVSLDGVSLGYTADGVRLSIRSQFNDIKTINLVGTKKRVLVDQAVDVVVNLAEGSLANMAEAIPGSSLVGSTLTLGGSDLQEGTLVLVGKGPQGKTRTVTITEVNPTGDVGIPYRKNQASVVPVTFSAIVQSDGTFGTIVDA